MRMWGQFTDALGTYMHAQHGFTALCNTIHNVPCTAFKYMSVKWHTAHAYETRGFRPCLANPSWALSGIARQEGRHLSSKAISAAQRQAYAEAKRE